MAQIQKMVEVENILKWPQNVQNFQVTNNLKNG